MRAIWLALLIFVSAHAHAKTDLELNFILAQLNERDQLIIVNLSSFESRWLVARKHGYSSDIPIAPSYLPYVDSVSVSPTNRKLAVISVGEGHPVLEVVSVPQLSEGGEYDVELFINPYPGGIWIEGWDGDKLILGTDVPLPPNAHLKPAEYPETGEHRTYTLDTDSGDLTLIATDSNE